MSELCKQLVDDCKKVINFVESDLDFTEDFEVALDSLLQTVKVYQMTLDELKVKGA